MTLMNVYSLKFQISAALISLLALFSGSIYYTMHHLDEYHRDTVTLRVASQLAFSVGRMNEQGLNYLSNAPRDYETYNRDVKLYYRDLRAHVSTIESMIHGFASGMLPESLEGIDDDMMLILPEHVRKEISTLEGEWQIYRKKLLDSLGDDLSMPRLEFASQHIVTETPALKETVDHVVSLLRSSSVAHQNDIALTNKWILGMAFVSGGFITFWFVWWVLRPLSIAVKGYQKVAHGDFGHQLPARSRNEIGLMNKAFNDLSRRMNALFKLIDRLQTGGDISETLTTVGEHMQPMVPTEWLAAVLINSDGRTARVAGIWCVNQGVERSALVLDLYSESAGSMLLPAVKSGKPTLLDVANQAAAGDHFVSLLKANQLAHAVLLPLNDSNDVQGVLVLGRRGEESFSEDDMQLLGNISPLLDHSFSRTVQFQDNARLATLGSFVSGIVHEIRNPLSTIGLALDYFTSKADIPEPAQRRAQLAHGEAQRMERLLQDILLYAKPVVLDTRTVMLHRLVSDFLGTYQSILAEKRQTVTLTGSLNVSLDLDEDRINQVLLNLLRNACEAAPEGSEIALHIVTGKRTVELVMENEGGPIPENVQARLWEPFFTTKAQGTGLGLSIVKRMLDAHAARIEVASSEHNTRFCLTFPV